MATATEYKVEYSLEAAHQLREIDGSVRGTIAKKVRSLKNSPSQIGKELRDKLAGYRSVPAAGRYRIVYRVLDGVEPERDADGALRWLGRVEVACLGIRKEGDKVDVYNVAEKQLGG